MLTRTRYQNGSLRVKKRKNGTGSSDMLRPDRMASVEAVV
jgi:hypothetical protein